MNSAPLKASACRLQVSLNFSDASRAIAKVGPRPMATRLSVSASTLKRHSSRGRTRRPRVQAAVERGVERMSPVHAAARRSSAANDATNVLVAATLSSGPAAIGSTMSEARASGLSCR